MRQHRRSDSNSKMVIVKESFSQNLASTIMNAAHQDKLITIKYYSNEKGITERVIEPMDIVIRMGKKNLVGWCRLRNDWRTFRLDRINFIAIQNEKFEPREDYRRENFEDEGVRYSAHSENKSARPSNKEFAFNTDTIKTMSENKLNFSNDNVKEYSDDEEELSL